MKLARLGNFGSEKPAIVISDTEAVFVDDVVADFNRETLSNGALDKLKKLDLTNRPKVKISDYRLGSPVARPTKAICVGLNYAKHAKESGAELPKEPVIFMKAPDTVVGGFDDIVIPPNSVKTDYEVEICVVIGKDALYLESPAKAKEHILGYTISQDVSERHWQIERSGQWVKGKSFPTFNPVGPWIVTADEFDPSDVRLWSTVDGEKRQDSRTSDMVFGIDHCVWYISQFMELKAGDIINTGTPAGVGMGHKPEKYLKPGQVVETGIDGIGTIKSNVVASK
ncbi:MAG: fumarylacetoacetate hydrolase family protein [Candidatus Nanopelagicales bacterium]|jgi:2-keto-4-pentenoate hydratase/2-oxohepta-3-ene-1,7-dioic acid hydratase in catechol pathway|nr:fumarylacetoacetate hydrolase family protein [Candidatus Nanopelagicales bacterium]MDP4746605.1 fumarylacetoacetate hydrolase family protein [Candidatus Nanopelagicales bacterium]